MLGSVVAALVSAFVRERSPGFGPRARPMPIWLTLAIGLAGTAIGGGIVLATVGAEPTRRRRRLHHGGGARPRLPPVRPEAAALGAGCIPLSEAGLYVEHRERLQRAGIDRTASPRRSRRTRRAPRRRPRGRRSPSRTTPPRTRRTTSNCSRSSTTAACSRTRSTPRRARVCSSDCGRRTSASVPVDLPRDQRARRGRAGAARASGAEPMGILATIGLGLAGRWWAACSPGSCGAGGRLHLLPPRAILLLYLYRRFAQHRPLTGPGAHRPPR